METAETVIGIAWGIFLLVFFVPTLFDAHNWKEVFDLRKYDVEMPKNFERKRRWQVFFIILAVLFLFAGFEIPRGWGFAVFIGVPAVVAFLISRRHLWDLW